MGKADKKAATGAADQSIATSRQEFGAGIGEQQSRIGTVMPRSDSERSQIWDRMSSGGKSAADYLGGLGGSTGGSGGGGGGGGVGPGAGQSTEDYVKTWEEMMGKEGGFDPTRLAGLGSDAAALREFAKRGGVTQKEYDDVNRQHLLDTEKTGGYSQGDIANIRNRSNRSIPGYYQNMQDSMQRGSTGNFGGPGMDRAAFKMARQGAQELGTQARDTEMDISESVRQGKNDASQFLSGQNLELAKLKGQNTLSGYKGASDIDLGTQDIINKTRLGASTAKGQDTRSREATAAASGAAAAARGDANARWAAQMEQDDRHFGAKGMLDTYQARPEELIYNQDLLRGYRQDIGGAGERDVAGRIGVGNMKDWSDQFGNVTGGISNMWNSYGNYQPRRGAQT